MVKLFVPLFCFLLSLLSHQTMSQPQYLITHCNSSDNFTQTSSYESNRETLLSSLREASSLGTYSNATIGLSPDTIYGMFLCRGDINTTSCSDCVQTATIQIARNCTLNKAAIIYYQKCMVRYSDVSFFTLMETKPGTGLHRNLPAPNANRFNQTLTDKFEQLILNVSLSSSIPYFLEDQERVTQLEGSYDLDSMVQCSPDLDPLNCTVCLRIGLSKFFSSPKCCGLPSVFQIFLPKCILRYETFVLPSPPTSSPSLPPPQSQTQPQTQNVPSPSGTYSINVIQGNEIFGRIVVTMTALVFALVDM